MPFSKRKVCLFAALLLGTVSLSAQNILSDYDSLPISRPKALKSKYKVNHPVIHEISILHGEPRAVTVLPKKFWGNLAEGTFTLLSGFSTSSSEEALWVSGNELRSNDETYNWQVLLFLRGEYMKNRERVQNEDGSSSVETQRGVYIDWSQGAYGLILEQGDTLGGFTLIAKPEADPDNLYWLSRIREESSELRDKLKKYEAGQMNFNFQLIGVLRGQLFSVLTNGSHYKSLLMLEEQPEAIFQNHPDYMILSKKDRIHPYLLLNKTLEEERKMDMIRLAFLNNLMDQSMRVDFYSR
ncbi:hypothetical protein [Catalinimonas niigatensis]|uniref:hypothetical protein n=1 Tax=Catalinimonas niigatensis TaxID=1397264 RepID=UPI002665DD8C|nr:hypothetical protein [Catalinimonas niigatensis]WPP52208.1 hypothetical protein PZB72_07425 [Catalinimonas niigatensis]